MKRNSVILTLVSFITVAFFVISCRPAEEIVSTITVVVKVTQAPDAVVIKVTPTPASVVANPTETPAPVEPTPLGPGYPITHSPPRPTPSPPTPSPLPPLTTAEEYFNRGLDFFKKGQYEAAINDFSQVISLDRDFADAFFHRGRILLQSGDNEPALIDLGRAIDLYTQAIVLDPQDAKTFVKRGQANMEIGELNRALADFNAAIESDPQNAEAFKTRADYFARYVNNERAIEDYDQAIILDPGNAAAYYGRGWAYYRRNSIGSQPEFQQQMAEIFSNLNTPYEEMSDLGRAFADLDRAAMLDWEYAYPYLADLEIQATEFELDLTRAGHVGTRGDATGTTIGWRIGENRDHYLDFVNAGQEKHSLVILKESIFVSSASEISPKDILFRVEAEPGERVKAVLPAFDPGEYQVICGEPGHLEAGKAMILFVAYP